MKIVLTLFLLISTLFGMQTKKLEKVLLQLHWKYQFEFAGFIAAKEKGFYKDAGLDVTLKEYEFGMDIEEDVLSGKSEYAIYNSFSLLEYIRGKDLVCKKIMATTKEDFKLNFQAYFDKYNVDINDVTLVPHTYRVDEFANGKVSAMTVFSAKGKNGKRSSLVVNSR